MSPYPVSQNDPQAPAATPPHSNTSLLSWAPGVVCVYLIGGSNVLRSGVRICVRSVFTEILRFGPVIGSRQRAGLNISSTAFHILNRLAESRIWYLYRNNGASMGCVGRKGGCSALILWCASWAAQDCAQAGACARRKEYHHYGLWRPKVVFTIHNAEYGLQRIGSAASYSQRFTTVSPSYASEVGPRHRPSQTSLAGLRGRPATLGLRHGPDHA